jgi:hypothetical protein
MKTLRFLLPSVFLLLPNSAHPQGHQEPQRPPDGGTREMLISILIPSLPNAPFTAIVNTEWIRQFADGTTITLKNRRAIARDTAGRIFQERRLLVPDDGKLRKLRSATRFRTHSIFVYPRNWSAKWRSFPHPSLRFLLYPPRSANPARQPRKISGTRLSVVWKPLAHGTLRSSRPEPSVMTALSSSSGSFGIPPSSA